MKIICLREAERCVCVFDLRVLPQSHLYPLSQDSPIPLPNAFGATRTTGWTVAVPVAFFSFP